MERVKEKIQETTARVLSDWAMMMVDECTLEENCFNCDEPFWKSQVAFYGPKKGSYTVICQEPLMKLLAENVLGEDGEEIEDSYLKDALKELANVLAGNLLTTMFSEEETYDLSPPVVEKITKDQVKLFLTKEPVVFLADDEPVLVTYNLEE
ncbi:MAG: chemotaxis protein CheX [Candidatus Dadabacteria bacterium]|nr:MAG: chemotaxis protein CheX [Candidatus Dadabacteria bacterium]